MKSWPKCPLIYEINTWVWLGALSRKYGSPVNLATVPEQEWDGIASLGFDAVWFMGVWERSPAGIEISMRNEGLLRDFRRALPDFSMADNVGSPYCVRCYVVDEHVGGASGLRTARERLAERGLRLILDFVPNHVAPDHPWVAAHPEYFIQGDKEDLRRDPGSFVSTGGRVLACGRDPYFPAWPDVLQLNAFNPGLRSAAVETVQEIADQCDGVRCDMAMLMMSDVFQGTWGGRARTRPDADYWPEIISAVKEKHPGFRFIARPTGVSSGSCSNTDLTTATTKGSTTAWSTTRQRACGCTSARTSLTRKSLSGSSRTTTNLVRRRPSNRKSTGRVP